MFIILMKIHNLRWKLINQLIYKLNFFQNCLVDIGPFFLLYRKLKKLFNKEYERFLNQIREHNIEISFFKLIIVI